MRDEISGVRPSRLSRVFRTHAEEGGRLADWTRIIDGDWICYCPLCAKVVVVIEEKGDNAKQTAWSVTRRLATRHGDGPWGWRVTTYPNETFTLTGARLSGDAHESFGETNPMSEDALIACIEKAFTHHYELEGHPLGSPGYPNKQGSGPEAGGGSRTESGGCRREGGKH